MNKDRWTVTPPPEAVTFDQKTFGMHTPRGFDVCRVSGESHGIPVSYLGSMGCWLEVDCDHHGAAYTLRDKDKKAVGWFYQPGCSSARELWKRGIRILPVRNENFEVLT